MQANYGGVLQNYALQYQLCEMGHTPMTLDIGKYDYLSWGSNMLKYIVKKVVLSQNVVPPPLPATKYKKIYPIRRFAEKNIRLTHHIKKYNERLIAQYGFDALVVGSDQVWRPCYSNVGNMFLDFAEQSNIIKIAYAASFGSDAWEFTEEQTEKCKRLAPLFRAISVREDKGIELCRRYLNVDAVKVADPTLLLDKEVYLKLCKDIPEESPDFLFAYILDGTPAKYALVQDIAKKLGLRVVFKSAESEVTLADSMEKWISFFRDAKYVVTDSFHGTVFSLIFNRDFYSIGNAKRGMSRFTSIFDELNLTDRLVDERQGISVEHMENIAWADVNKKKEEMVNRSKCFLQANLIQK